MVATNIVEICGGKETLTNGGILKIFPYLENYGINGKKICKARSNCTLYAAMKTDPDLVHDHRSGSRSFIEPPENSAKRLEKIESQQGWMVQSWRLVNGLILSFWIEARGNAFGRGETRGTLIFVRIRDTAPLYRIRLIPGLIDGNVPHFVEGRFDILDEEFILTKGLIGANKTKMPLITKAAQKRVVEIQEISPAKIEVPVMQRVNMEVDGEFVEVVKIKKTKVYSNF